MALVDQFRKFIPRPRKVEVGWFVDSEKASLIHDDPRPIHSVSAKPPSSKAVQACPAANDFESRYFEIPCPLDLDLKFRFGPDEKPLLYNAAGSDGVVSTGALRNFVKLMPRQEWRHPERPILQMPAPYRFIADEPVWMSQMLAFLHWSEQHPPGRLIGGRMPIHIWPRALSWAFEWFDISRNLVLRRGDPWFYVHFETENPDAHVRLTHAEVTDELTRYCRGLDGVTHYVSQTFSLFETARSRRPKKLLVKRKA